MSKVRGFKVRDFRQKQFFMVDDIYLNGFAQLLGVTASMIYISLCRHTGKDQKCFPSQKLIAKELNINERTVMNKIKVLSAFRLVEVTRMKNKKGKWINNVYTLLDKNEWTRLPTYKKDTGGKTTYIKTTKPPTSKLQYKDTHMKDTHNNRGLVDKITKWAYMRAGSPPNCSTDSFRKAVQVAIDRAGAKKVNRAFEGQENAIQFLVNLRSL